VRPPPDASRRTIGVPRRHVLIAPACAAAKAAVQAVNASARGSLALVGALCASIGEPATAARPDKRPARKPPDGPGPDGLTTAQLAAFLRTLQAALRSGSSAKVADLVSFPLRVHAEDGTLRRFIGQTQFAIDYPTLFTPPIQATLLQQAVSEIQRSVRGAALAGGAVWVAGLCSDLQCAQPTPKIVAVHVGKA